jgi:hypothetical protein
VLQIEKEREGSGDRKESKPTWCAFVCVCVCFGGRDILKGDEEEEKT